ncbi:hypothetical protein DY000_02008791 [Brassica cretica]|uniref:Uncharacterized protein n=1 Tax=Brassica cretica TaxID=69181 RepID=A0ABQ7C6X3_BRACR|nr:hypothetical protein DY000_02008791 [Brassica cretica]
MDARSLRSDRAWLKLGRYGRSVATLRPSLVRDRSLRSDRATCFGLFSDVSCFFRRALPFDAAMTKVTYVRAVEVPHPMGQGEEKDVRNPSKNVWT